jgi:hypothetical protein
MNRNYLHPATYRQVYFWSVLIILYFSTRFYNLTAFPIFSDEAIYIHWAQIISEDWGELFISKTDGKLPLYIWLVALILPYFDDPLVAGRVISIIAGFFTLVGVIHIGRKYYSPGVGWLAGIFYIICPYTLHLERMAMLESLLTACGVWIIIITLEINQKKTTPAFILLGTLIGLAFLTKATALLIIPVIVGVLLIKKISWKPEWIKGLAYSLAIPIIMSLPFFLSNQEPAFEGRHAIFNNPDYYLSVDSFLSFPLMIWLRNFWVISDFYRDYLSTTFIFLTLVFLAETIKEKNRTGWILILWAGFPPLVIILIANGFYSRYFLMSIPPVILIGAQGYICLAKYITQKLYYSGIKIKPEELKPLILNSVLLVLVLVGNLMFCVKLITNPEKAPLPFLDRLLYFEGMPSGYGIKEAADFITRESKKKPLILITTVDLGNPQEGVSVYLWKKENIKLLPISWSSQNKNLMPEESISLLASKHQRTPVRQESVSKLENIYFLYPFTAYPESLFLKNNPGFEKVWTYAHLNGRDSIKIFKQRS